MDRAGNPDIDHVEGGVTGSPDLERVASPDVARTTPSYFMEGRNFVPGNDSRYAVTPEGLQVYRNPAEHQDAPADNSDSSAGSSD